MEEISKAVKSLNKGKASGKDGVTAEHLIYAGRGMLMVLCRVYNHVRLSEYIPVCYRVGVQVHLHKGKGVCPLDPNSYRGITLLSVFNKVFEILVWHRIEAWWVRSGVVSGLQSACR